MHTYFNIEQSPLQGDVYHFIGRINECIWFVVEESGGYERCLPRDLVHVDHTREQYVRNIMSLPQ